MRHLTLGEVVALHRAILAATGGADGIGDSGALESALAQPKATFGGTDLYPSIVNKASAKAAPTRRWTRRRPARTRARAGQRRPSRQCAAGNPYREANAMAGAVRSRAR